MTNFFKKSKYLPSILIIFGFVLVNIIFNARVFWNELIFDHSKVGAVWGEVQVFEWLTDTFYKNLITGKNPFALSQGMLYPFKIQLGLTDAGNGLFFIFLRPFLSIHQSMSVIVALSLFAANIGMYLLLRKLSFDRAISFIISLAYGFMTFLMPRLGHLNYWCIFVFPWFFYCAHILLTATRVRLKIAASITSALFFVLTLWLNFYYFILLTISIITLLIYHLFINSTSFKKVISTSWKYLLLFFISFFIFLIPWIIALYDVSIFDQIPRVSGWGGAIEYSSDLFNFFIPSGYNQIIYNHFAQFYSRALEIFLPFATSIFENFTYSGIIIIGIFCFYLYFIFKKKQAFFAYNRKLLPYLVAAMVFLLLSMGPFLHVFGHWRLNVGDGIYIVVPLPYILMHYLPFLQNVRVPGRLIVGFIFFAYIVSAYVLSFFLKGKSKNFKILFFALLFVIFFIDQRYTDRSTPESQIYPYRIFKEIKKDKDNVSVLEIPFTVRDGFSYFGDSEATAMIVGQSIHGKPVLGGYTGRMADYKRNYYMNNPLFGYLGRMIDQGLDTNPILDKTNLEKWKNIDIESSRDVVDFLDIKYVVTNNKKKYISSIFAILEDLSYHQVMVEGSFSLWKRNISNKEFININPTDKNVNTYLGMGWQNKNHSDELVSDAKSSLMVKVNKPRRARIKFTARGFKKDQKIIIFVNKKRVATEKLSNVFNEYSSPTTFLNKGINTIHFFSLKENSSDNSLSLIKLSKDYNFAIRKVTIE